MKKIQYLMMCVAAAAAALTGCSKEEATQDPALTGKEVVMSVTASGADTRTQIDENNKISWQAEGEALYIGEMIDGQAPVFRYTNDQDYKLAGDGSASFTVSFTENTSGSDYQYVAVYPKSALITDNYANYEKVKVTLPAEQTPTATSYDPEADLMIAQLIAQPAQASELKFAFGRVSALAKMTITNLNLAEGEQVAKVTFQATDKKLAGRSYLNLATGEIVELGYYGASDLLTLDYTAVEGLNPASFPVWFACLPCELAAGETFTVTILSDQNKSYTKQVTLTDAQTLSFISGDVASFTVDMTGIEGEGEEASTARIATLTYAEVADLTCSYDKSAYYTNASGTWEIRAYKQGNLQLNGSKGYIKLPLFAQNISLIEVTTNSTTATRSLMFNTENATSNPIAQAEEGSGATSFLINVANEAGNYTTGYLKSSGTLQITGITVYTGSVLLADNIAGVAAAGVSDATSTYEPLAFTESDDTKATCDGTIVTAASVDTDSKTITYSVAANKTADAREGWITLTSAANGTTTTITVSQLAQVSSYYQLVETDLTDWSGKYLIVGHGSTNCFMGVLDGTWGGSANVTITDKQIGASSDVEPYVCTLIKSGEGYLIQVADGNYIASVSSKTFAIGPEGGIHTITFDPENGISLTLANKYAMRCNTGKFRYYTSTTGTAVDLYRLTD